MSKTGKLYRSDLMPSRHRAHNCKVCGNGVCRRRESIASQPGSETGGDSLGTIEGAVFAPRRYRRAE